MSDTGYVKVLDPTSASVVEGIVVPAKDGVYTMEVTAHHHGTGHGRPEMWLKIEINDVTDYESKRIQWQDGPASMQGVTTELMKAGQQYRVVAKAGNLNADGKGISMKIARL